MDILFFNRYYFISNYQLLFNLAIPYHLRKTFLSLFHYLGMILRKPITNKYSNRDVHDLNNYYTFAFDTVFAFMVHSFWPSPS